MLLGPGGFKKQIAGFNVERIGNTARSLALGRYAFELAREHAAMQRKQFGRPLCEFQGLQWKFADMKIKLDAAQLLLYRAAANADAAFPSAEETAIAKAACNLAGFEVANEALQVMGGMGYSEDIARRVLPAPLPRLDDRRRLDRDPEEPHRRARLRPPLPAAARIKESGNFYTQGCTQRVTGKFLIPFSRPWRRRLSRLPSSARLRRAAGAEFLRRVADRIGALIDELAGADRAHRAAFATLSASAG